MKKDTDVISVYRQAFRTVTHQLKELLMHWAMQKLDRLPETEKHQENSLVAQQVAGCALPKHGLGN